MISYSDPHDVHALRIETTRGEDVARVTLRGEADFSTLRDLDAALERVELDGAASVQLHISELYFADAATIRRLTVFARDVRRAGHEIRTCGANQAIHKVARLLDVQEELGLA
jgi:anti-anti-sigma factor